VKRYICHLLILFPLGVVGQQLPLGQQVMNDFNILMLQTDSQQVFTGYRSMDWLEVKHYLDSTAVAAGESVFGTGESAAPATFTDRLMHDHWIRVRRKKTMITADPVLEATAAKSNRKEGILWDGTMGARIRGNIRDKCSFGLGVYTSISEFPAYIDRFTAANNNMVPGQHQSHRSKNGRYDYSSLDAYITYVPDKHIVLSAGYGKQFIGDGYRSLLLSDNAFNYPYIRLRASFWKLNYNVMYSYLENDRKIDGRRQGK